MYLGACKWVEWVAAGRHEGSALPVPLIVDTVRGTAARIFTGLVGRPAVGIAIDLRRDGFVKRVVRAWVALAS